MGCYSRMEGRGGRGGSHERGTETIQVRGPGGRGSFVRVDRKPAEEYLIRREELYEYMTTKRNERTLDRVPKGGMEPRISRRTE